MKNIFKTSNYCNDLPIPANKILVQNIPVQHYYDFYFSLLMEDLTAEYGNEWLLKQYVIYYISAPGFNFLYTREMYKNRFNEISLAEMILELYQYNVEPFEI